MPGVFPPLLLLLPGFMFLTCGFWGCGRLDLGGLDVFCPAIELESLDARSEEVEVGLELAYGPVAVKRVASAAERDMSGCFCFGGGSY